MTAAVAKTEVYGLTFDVVPRDMHRPPSGNGSIPELYLVSPRRTTETFVASRIEPLIDRVQEIGDTGGRVYGLDLHLLLATILWADGERAQQIYQRLKRLVQQGTLLSLDITIARTAELFDRPILPGLNTPFSSFDDIQARANIIDTWGRRNEHGFSWPGPLGTSIDTLARIAITVIGWNGCNVDHDYLDHALTWTENNAPADLHEKSAHDNFRAAQTVLRDDGRFHPHYRQTITLRLAASAPGIQAFTSRINLPYVPRGLVIPDEPDHVLASIDLRSAELFALGHVWRRWYSDEEAGGQLLDDLASEFDTPSELGRLILQDMPDATPKLIREAGKFAGFASINLSRPTTISARLIEHFGCPTATFEAVQRGLRWYKKRYPIDAWHRDAKERRKEPFVLTPGGRAVKTGNPSETGGRIFQTYLAEAQNMALLALVETGIMPVLQLHDEIILSTPEGDIPRATKVYTDAVAAYMGGQEGLRVRVKIAPDRWSNLHEF